MKTRSLALGTTRGNAARRPVSRPDAEALALAALAFLASDVARLERFLSLTGLNPNDLRQLATEPGLLASVLDHLAGDERLLLHFCEEGGHDPLTVMQARQALGGDSPWDSM